MKYYVLELDTPDGPVEISMVFRPGYALLQSDFGSVRLKLTKENVLALAYLIAKYSEKVLTPEEMKALL
ncbi:hypothetical protein [Thermococcus sp. Bubb.Bath]|uniref:hypothetical protein n=1 Tax=Thermococcus sp. Bubb.Bath TaxID=1638242 RepID=UPI00143A5006|nr:hypothetical protein [Thermococcus sp. Bubb.Bath]NJF24402.1 hypothetical protein [Thermococcus sp. Bubb.Bath]